MSRRCRVDVDKRTHIHCHFSSAVFPLRIEDDLSYIWQLPRILCHGPKVNADCSSQVLAQACFLQPGIYEQLQYHSFIPSQQRRYVINVTACHLRHDKSSMSWRIFCLISRNVTNWSNECTPVHTENRLVFLLEKSQPQHEVYGSFKIITYYPKFPPMSDIWDTRHVERYYGVWLWHKSRINTEYNFCKST